MINWPKRTPQNIQNSHPDVLMQQIKAIARHSNGSEGRVSQPRNPMRAHQKGQEESIAQRKSNIWCNGSCVITQLQSNQCHCSLQQNYPSNTAIGIRVECIKSDSRHKPRQGSDCKNKIQSPKMRQVQCLHNDKNKHQCTEQPRHSAQKAFRTCRKINNTNPKIKLNLDEKRPIRPIHSLEGSVK